jgi:hypothetical protein
MVILGLELWVAAQAVPAVALAAQPATSVPAVPAAAVAEAVPQEAFKTIKVIDTSFKYEPSEVPPVLMQMERLLAQVKAR